MALRKTTVATVNAMVLNCAVTRARLCVCTKFKIQENYQNKMTSKVSKWNVRSAPAKGATQIQQLSEAAAILVSNKAELIGEREALMLTKGTIRDNNTEVMSLLRAEHDRVKEYITKTEVPLECLLLAVTFKTGKNKLNHIQRLEVTPDVEPQRWRFRIAVLKYSKGMYMQKTDQTWMSWPQEADWRQTTRSDGNTVLIHPTKQLPKSQGLLQGGMSGPGDMSMPWRGPHKAVGTPDGGRGTAVCVNCCSPCRKSPRSMLLSSPFYGWGSQGAVKLRWFV